MRAGEKTSLGGVGPAKDEKEKSREAISLVSVWFFFFIVRNILLTLPDDPFLKKR